MAISNTTAATNKGEHVEQGILSSSPPSSSELAPGAADSSADDAVAGMVKSYHETIHGKPLVITVHKSTHTHKHTHSVSP